MLYRAFVISHGQDWNEKKNHLEQGGFLGGGGERGIRTPDTLLTYTHFPGVRIRPLCHLSGLVGLKRARIIADFLPL